MAGAPAAVDCSLRPLGLHANVLVFRGFLFAVGTPGVSVGVRLAAVLSLGLEDQPRSSEAENQA